MVKSLITGITGFVGSHLAELLLRYGEEVYGTTRWRSPKDNIKGILNQVTLVECDLTDAAAVDKCIKEVQPDFIYHLAAQSYVVSSFIEPAATIEVNVIGTLHLLEAVRHFCPDCIVHVCSSSEVYGQVKEDEVPIKETNQLRPASPYAVSKVGEDMIALQYFLSYGVKTIRSRAYTHTGPRRGEIFVLSAFAKQVALIEAGLQEPVIHVGNLDSIRTFLDVRDMVGAYRLLTRLCKPGEVYNIGGNETMTIGEMLDILLELSPDGDKIEIYKDPKLFRPSDVTLQIPDTSKFVKATGWKPSIRFGKTIKDTLNYWREKVSG